MIIRFKWWKYRFTFTFAPVTDVIGVNSLLPDKNHILMWDFDKFQFWVVLAILRSIQYKYDLPRIRILESSDGWNYIAYCFKRCTWRKAKEIIASTDGVDEQFFKYGVYRGYFTLRVSQKKGSLPILVRMLESKTQEDVSVDELDSWVVYETLDK